MEEKFNLALGRFLAFLLALMLLCVCWQVLTRYLLGNPSSFTDELARYLLIWIGMLGGAYASGQNMHLSIDLLPGKLTGKPKIRLQIAIHLLIIFFVVATFIIGGSRLVFITYSLGQTSAAMQIPVAYIYLIIPISGLVIMYYKVKQLSGLITSFTITNS